MKPTILSNLTQRRNVSCLAALSFILATFNLPAFTYTNFNSTAGLNLVGVTAVVDGALRLTPEADSVVGTAWAVAKQPCAGGFDTSFQFRISNPGGRPGTPPGGDGLLFTIQNIGPTDPSYHANTSPADGSVSVFFNTFWNWPDSTDFTLWDVSGNSVGVVSNGLYLAQTDLNPRGVNLKDGVVHDAHIAFDGTGLTVWLDGVVVLTNVPVPGMASAVDAAGNAWVGFDAGTGWAWENHDILSWSFSPATASGCVPPPSGLVSWWRGEGNAVDQVGGNNGTPLNGVGFASGEVGLAFKFNGTNSYVEVPDSPSLQMTNELTIEFWVKRQSLQNEDYIINKGGDYTRGMLNYGVTITQPQWGGTLAFTFAGGARHSLSITDLNWHHCAVTARDGDVDPSFYVDGVQRPVTLRQGASTINLYPSTEALHIGAQVDPISGWFYYSKAIVDEVSIYSRALAAAEIQAIYSAGSLGKCPLGMAPSIITQPASQTVLAGSPATFTVTAVGTAPLQYQWRFNGTNITGASGTSLTLSNVQPAQAGNYLVVVTNAYGSTNSANALLTVNPPPPCTPTPSGLVSWWRGEGSASDSVGGNNGTLEGGMAFVAGKVGQAFSFNGVDADVRVPGASNLNVGAGAGLTIEGWINPAEVNSQLPIAEWSSPTWFNMHFWIATPVAYGGGGPGSLYANLIDTTSAYHQIASAGGVVIANTYQHVAMTYEKGSGSAVLYLNGVVVKQASLGSFTPLTTGDLHLGLRPVGGAAGTRFVGQMDEMAIYSRALTTNEIAAIYNAGAAGKCVALNRIPVAQCADAIVSAGANCQADASINHGSFDPDGDAITVRQEPPGPYPLGTNRVTLIVTDDKGASNSCSALVIVLDRTPPTLNCPDGKVLEFQDEKGTVATYSVTATDACSTVTLVATPPSGSVFPIGVTPVNVQATDGSGNSAQCSFMVTVLGAQGVRSNVLAQLVALRSSSKLTQPFVQMFDETIRHLTISLNPAFWIDQTHLQPKDGNRVMNEDKLVVIKLWEIMDSKKHPVDPALLQGFIDRIVKSDRLLAVISIQDAGKAGLNARKVAEALALVAQGDREAATGHYANAIEHYRNAWRQTLQLRLQVGLNPDGTTRLQFVGSNGKSYLIEVSTDLVRWASLGTCTADAEGNVAFTDPNTTKQPLRFYRAIER